MPKPEKVGAVEDLTARFRGSAGALITAFRGMKVEEMRELRRTLAAAETDYKVVKNTLARIAARRAGLAELLPILEGPTAIAFVRGDPVAAAKSLDEMAKKYPALAIKGGLLEGKVLGPEQAQDLARVKPREVLLAELAGVLQAPVQKMASLLLAPIRDLGYALGAYRDKLQGGAQAAS